LAKDRQRAREARQAARRRELETAAARRERLARRQAARTRLTPSLPRRRRRYGALSTFALVKLLLVFLAVQVGAHLLEADLRVRLVVAVVTLASLAVLVRTRRRTPR
jgi:Flp pilus assembly protein TadB